MYFVSAIVNILEYTLFIARWTEREVLSYKIYNL